MKTPEEIAQWVINNRYPHNEKQKVSDVEMYHTLVESIANLCNLPVVNNCALCGSDDLFKFKLEHIKCRKCGAKFEHGC